MNEFFAGQNWISQLTQKNKSDDFKSLFVGDNDTQIYTSPEAAAIDLMDKVITASIDNNQKDLEKYNNGLQAVMELLGSAWLTENDAYGTLWETTQEILKEVNIKNNEDRASNLQILDSAMTQLMAQNSTSHAYDFVKGSSALTQMLYNQLLDTPNIGDNIIRRKNN